MSIFIKVLNPSHATPRSFHRVKNEEVLNRVGRVPHKRLIHRSIVAWNFYDKSWIKNRSPRGGAGDLRISQGDRYCDKAFCDMLVAGGWGDGWWLVGWLGATKVSTTSTRRGVVDDDGGSGRKFLECLCLCQSRVRHHVLRCLVFEATLSVPWVAKVVSPKLMLAVN